MNLLGLVCPQCSMKEGAYMSSATLAIYSGTASGAFGRNLPLVMKYIDFLCIYV